MRDEWNPEQYLKFEKDREKPFFDLMNMVIPKPHMRILDLGCGTGKLTQVLHDTLKAEATLGIDASIEMLKKAPSPISQALTLELKDISEFSMNEKYDLIFSNAALHWIQGHDQLFARIFNALKEGGQIAIQVPSNFSFPTHTIAKEVARDNLFQEALKNAEFPSVLTIEKYSELLYRLGASKQVVRAEIYPLILPSADAAIEFVKGSLMTHYRTHLSDELYQEFLKRYSERIGEHFGKGEVFIPFKRILMWASI